MADKSKAVPDRASEIAAKLPAKEAWVLTFSDGQKFFSLEGAAEFLGVSRQTIWRWHKAHKLHGARVGRVLYIPESSIKALVKGQKT
jgi:excisionase family DNA binding protein